MRITVIGTGYVGLVTGACLAEMGNQVLCLDADARKVRVLDDGGLPFHEPGLKEMVRRNRLAHRISFTTDADAAVAHATLVFVAVGTPPRDDGSCDLQHVFAAARDIGARMRDDKVVVLKSTVPVGTCERVRAAIGETLAARGETVHCAVASNPEFLKEGAAVQDFMRPDRIVVGTDDPRALLLLRALYAPFMRNRDRLVVMDTRSAEFTKYAANAMLATRISFMNELSRLAERVGADIERVRQGIGSDPRIGTHFLYAGAGFGGSCFPKDVAALVHTAEEHGVPLQLLAAVRDVNERQKHVLVDKVIGRFGADLSPCRIAVWGLAFKPGTDDMREAPSRVVIRELLEHGAEVVAYDPLAVPEAQRVMAELTGRWLHFADEAVGAVEGADALVVVTDWKEFKSPDFVELRRAMRQPVVFDGRNLYEPELVRAMGLEYHGIGRPEIA